MLSAEIIAGIFREADIVTLSGWANVGKTPLLKDWSICIAGGVPWCGQAVTLRPVLLLDFESKTHPFYEGAPDAAPPIAGWNLMCQRRGVQPGTLDAQVYIDHGNLDDPRTLELQSIPGMTYEQRFGWLDAKIAAKPDALVIVDPLALLFNVDKNKSQAVVALYSRLRALQRKYRSVSFLLVFNLRKRDRHADVPPLLENPHDWLQECAGTLDIQNRSDVRLGMEPLKEGELEPVVLHGFRRGEAMEPFVLEPAWYGERMCGFQRVPYNTLDLNAALSPRMRDVWECIPAQFTRTDAEHACSRATAYRFIARALALGLIVEESAGVYTKRDVQATLPPRVASNASE